jgi:hypothetical protein
VGGEVCQILLWSDNREALIAEVGGVQAEFS